MRMELITYQSLIGRRKERLLGPISQQKRNLEAVIRTKEEVLGEIQALQQVIGGRSLREVGEGEALGDVSGRRGYADYRRALVIDMGKLQGHYDQLVVIEEMLRRQHAKLQKCLVDLEVTYEAIGAAIGEYEVEERRAELKEEATRLDEFSALSHWGRRGGQGLRLHRTTENKG